MKVIVMNNQARSLVNFWTLLLQKIQENGHEVLCLVPEGDDKSDEALRRLGVSVLHYSLDRKGLNPLRDIKTCVELYRLFQQSKADILYASTIKPVIYGLPMATLAGIRNRYAMITGLGYMFEGDTLFKKALTCLASVLYRFALSFTQVVFFQNADDILTFQEKHCLPKAIQVVQTKGTGVNTVHFAAADLPEGGPVFLLVGRLLEAKGIYDFAEAARLVKKDFPSARFQLLGPQETQRGGVPLEIIRNWADVVEYLGETRDVRPFLAQSTVLVLPSWREGLPCSLMEGMSVGRPLVATDVPGCRDLVKNGENGFLVPAHNPKELAKAMARFAADPSLAQRMGQISRHLALTIFDADKAMQQILACMNLSK